MPISRPIEKLGRLGSVGIANDGNGMRNAGIVGSSMPMSNPIEKLGSVGKAGSENDGNGSLNDGISRLQDTYSPPPEFGIALNGNGAPGAGVGITGGTDGIKAIENPGIGVLKLIGPISWTASPMMIPHPPFEVR